MSHPIDAYCEQVLTGALPAGKYHRLACARHVRDLARIGDPDFPYVLDYAKADRFLRFGEKLKHWKGEWSGQFIRWAPFQIFRLGSIFGWVHKDTGLRRFRNAYNELPRKQGKSLEAAVVALYVTFFDVPTEPGAEGYCAATKRDQAKIVFTNAKRLVMSSGLRSRIAVLMVNLHREATGSKLEPIGADEDSTDGLNSHFVSLDELHAIKARGLIDVLETSTGARRQPLIFKITTSGTSLLSPCGEEHTYACNILDEIIEDDSYFAFIAHAEPDDDWTAPETARKANPNYGVSVNPAILASTRTKAKGIESAVNAYKQKHLNLWVNAFAPWLSLDGWRAGQSRSWTAEDLYHAACFAGIDLASKLDLVALVLLFPPTELVDRWRILRWIWTPADTVEARALKDRAPYPQWIKQGALIAAPGTRVDHRLVCAALNEARTHFEIQQIGFDPWHGDQTVAQLVDDGFDPENLIEVPQTFAGMSAGCKELEGAVLAGEVDAADCPVMQWAVANAVAKKDDKDNVFPVKKRSRGRIDPIVATSIAWNLAIRMAPEEPAEDPDLVVA